MTWEAEDPELWAKLVDEYPDGWWRWSVSDAKLWLAVTAGYGPKWWDTYPFVDDLNKLEDERKDKGLCTFCGTPLATSEDAVAVLPPRPLAGPFCKPECADNHLMFYCIREGK